MLPERFPDTSHHSVLPRWTVASARPLVPAIEKLLNVARQSTKSITVRMSLIERPETCLAHFVAVGEFSPVYDRLAKQIKERVVARAVDEKKPVVIPDTHRSEEWQGAKSDAKAANNREYLRLLDSFRSEIAIPLFDSRDRVTAVINLHHREVDGLTWASVDEIEDLTVGTARAIENAIRYLLASQQRSWGDDLLQQLGLLIVDTKFGADAGESIYDLTTKKALELSHAEFAGLWLLDTTTNELHLASFNSCSERLADKYVKFRTPSNLGIRGLVLGRGTAYYCPSTAKDLEWFPCLIGVNSCYTLPLAYEDQVFGVVCIDSFRTEAFDRRLREVLDLFGKLCGALIGASYRKSGERIEALSRRALLRATSKDDIYRRAIDEIRSLVKCESATVFCMDPVQRKLKLVATTGLAPGYDTETTYDLGEGITGWVGAKRVPLRLRHCSNIEELRRWDSELKWEGKTLEIASRKGFERPLLVVPVLDDAGTCIGVIRASGKLTGAEFAEEDKLAVAQFARVLATELPRVIEPLDEPRKPEDVERNLRRILSRCVRDCRADAGTIAVIRADQLVCLGYEGTLTVREEELTRPLSAPSVTTFCARWGQMQVVPDLGAYWRDIYQTCFANIQSELAVPMIGHGQVLGVLNVESTKKDFFKLEQQVRMQKYADLAGGQILSQPLAGAVSISPVPTSVMGAALAQFRKDLPRLLRESAGQWVAYKGKQRIDVAASKTQLYEQCISSGYKRGEFIVRCIEPELDEWIMPPNFVDSEP